MRIRRALIRHHLLLEIHFSLLNFSASLLLFQAIHDYDYDYDYDFFLSLHIYEALSILSFFCSAPTHALLSRRERKRNDCA